MVRRSGHPGLAWPTTDLLRRYGQVARDRTRRTRCWREGAREHGPEVRGRLVQWSSGSDGRRAIRGRLAVLLLSRFQWRGVGEDLGDHRRRAEEGGLALVPRRRGAGRRRRLVHFVGRHFCETAMPPLQWRRNGYGGHGGPGRDAPSALQRWDFRGRRGVTSFQRRLLIATAEGHDARVADVHWPIARHRRTDRADRRSPHACVRVV